MKTAKIEVSLIDHCGDDLRCVNAARVSFHKESEWLEGQDIFETEYGYYQWDGAALVSIPEDEVVKKLSERDTKLINYLAKHKHFSPFNHCFLTFRVKAPVFVARQLVKHKFMPWNEVSRRYVDDEPEFYFPDTWRARAADKKQGSGEAITERDTVDTMLGLHLRESIALYKDYLDAGVAPEQARMVLPQNTMTEWFWSGTLGAFCDMLRLRLKPDAQQESREVAQMIAIHVERLFPVSYKALLNETV